MIKNKAIPEGYMTVGEVAKKMKTTVRTLQYYDKEDVLKPSGESEGGRRLYTNKDLVRLHQIQSMKYLGFTLDDIRNRLPLINTPKEVSELLGIQAQMVREKINDLTTVLESIEKLDAEVLQMQTVDWEKYADILILLKKKDENYTLIKHFDEKMIERIRDFDDEAAETFMINQNQILEKFIRFQKQEVAPDSDIVQGTTKEFWDMIVEFTGGDLSLIPKLNEFYDTLLEKENTDYQKRYAMAKDYLEHALQIYLESIGVNLF